MVWTCFVMIPFSCTKGPGTGVSDPSSGISFTASAASEAEDTKTTYTGDGTFSSEGKLTKERIDWVNGDMIRIVSAQAQVLDKSVTPWVLRYSSDSPRYSLADYTVATHKKETDVISRATITPVGGNGLQWGTGDHTFYAMYPSRETSGYSAAEKAKIGINHEKMMGTIPAVQSPDLSGAKGWPDMRYAFMFGTAQAPSGADAVNLPFYPEFTAFEFTIAKGDNESVELSSFTLETTASGGVLTGDFTLTNASGWNSAVTTSNTGSSLTVDLSGVTLNAAKESLTFTVLCLPVNLGSLKLTFTGPQLGTRSLKLNDKNDTPLSFTARKKYRIFGMSFPAGLSTEGEDILWDLEGWGGVVYWENEYIISDLEASASAPHTGGEVVLSSAFKSYQFDNTSYPEPFYLEWSEDGAGNWHSGLPDWLSVAASVDMNGSVDGQELRLVVAPQEDSYVNPHTTELRSRAAKTNFDLSTVNVATGQTVSRTTANCYVVDAPGSYRFPAVYGNGVKDGAVNEAAYMALALRDNSYNWSNGSLLNNNYIDTFYGSFLGRYFDHMNNPITSPYIATQHAGKSFSVELLWTDEPGLVQNVSLAGSGEQMYITFDVPSSSIRQGNAGIALKADGVIAWSWHIWVTDSDLTSVENAPDSGNKKSFSPENVGWCSRRDIQYDARTAYVRAVNAAGGSSAVSKVEQTAATFRYSGENPLFQFGRKDPIVPQRYLVNKAGNTSQQRFYKTVYGHSYETTADKLSVGRSIQTPTVFSVNVTTTGSNVRISTDRPGYPTYLVVANSWNSNYLDDLTTSYGEGDLINRGSQKTIYDPSPVGYKVPMFNLNNDLTVYDYNSEYRYRVQYVSKEEYPLSGNYFSGAGGVTVATNVGVVGEYWCDFHNALFPYTARYIKYQNNKDVFRTVRGGPNSADYKWVGKSVRPIAETSNDFLYE